MLLSQDGNAPSTAPEQADEAPRSELYPSKDEGRMENLPNRSIQAVGDPGVRTHGAASVSDAAYWTGHSLGVVCVVVALALIILGRGPRKRDAMDSLWQQKQQVSASRVKAGR